MFEHQSSVERVWRSKKHETQKKKIEWIGSPSFPLIEIARLNEPLFAVIATSYCR